MILPYGLEEIFANEIHEDCENCIVNSKDQILTIFKFETEDLPFLAKTFTVQISPNPYAHTLSKDNIDPRTFGINLIITDNGKLDNDPMPGVIELRGVNHGVYSVIELKGPPGFYKTNDVFSSSEIFSDSNSHVGITNVGVDHHSFEGLIAFDAPSLTEEQIEALLAHGASLSGNVLLTSPDQLPPPIMLHLHDVLGLSPPPHIFFNSITDSSWTPEEQFSNLAIPEYSAPSVSSIDDEVAFIPPVFVSENDDESNLILSPILDELAPGTNLVLRLDQTEFFEDGTSISSATFPIDTFGQDVGISMQVHSEPPPGFTEFNPGTGESAIWFNLETIGNLDFGDPSTFSSPPVINFNVHSDGDTCSPVAVFLFDEELNEYIRTSPDPQRNPPMDGHDSCAFTQEFQQFSSYVIGSGISGGTGGSSGHDHSDGHGHSGGHGHSHSHGEHSHGDEGHGHESEFQGTSLGYYSGDGVEAFQPFPSTEESSDTSETSDKSDSSKDLETIEFGGTIQEKPKLEFGRPVEKNILKFGEKLHDETIPFGLGTKPATMTVLGLAAQDFGYDFGDSFSGTRLIVEVEEKTFPIKYKLNGQITKIAINPNDKSVSFSLENVLESDFIIRVPRTLIDAENNEFIISVTASPERLVAYSVIESEDEFVTLKLTAPDYAKQVTIIGTNVVPEFGIFSALIFVVAISSSVLIFRSKFARGVNFVP